MRGLRQYDSLLHAEVIEACSGVILLLEAIGDICNVVFVALLQIDGHVADFSCA